MSKFLLIDYDLNVVYTDTLNAIHKARITGEDADLVIVDISDPDNPQELDQFFFKFFPVISEEEWLEQQRAIEEECDFGMGSPS